MSKKGGWSQADGAVSAAALFAGQQTVAAACQGDGETRAELQGGAATKSPLPFVKH